MCRNCQFILKETIFARSPVSLLIVSKDFVSLDYKLLAAVSHSYIWEGLR